MPLKQALLRRLILRVIHLKNVSLKCSGRHTTKTNWNPPQHPLLKAETLKFVHIQYIKVIFELFQMLSLCLKTVQSSLSCCYRRIWAVNLWCLNLQWSMAYGKCCVFEILNDDIRRKWNTTYCCVRLCSQAGLFCSTHYYKCQCEFKWGFLSSEPLSLWQSMKITLDPVK